jgi:hypothetical protein
MRPCSLEKTGGTALEGDDLAVDDVVFGRRPGQRRNQFRVGIVKLLAVSGQQLQTALRRNTRQRSPSSLRSKIQCGEENHSSVRVASMGCVHLGIF